MGDLEEQTFDMPDQPDSGHKNIKVFDNAVQFKTASVENYPLLFIEDANSYSFCIKDIDSALIGFLIAEKNTLNSKAALIISRTWVESKYRNQGFMTAIYNTLHNQGFTLISDNLLAPNSIKLWKELSKRNTVIILDVDSGITRNINDNDFTVTDKNTRFALEEIDYSNHIFKEALERKKDNSILQEYRYYIGMKEQP